jgi:hypothetical protein
VNLQHQLVLGHTNFLLKKKKKLKRPTGVNYFTPVYDVGGAVREKKKQLNKINGIQPKRLDQPEDVNT